jgi:Na+-translocating ferredoxin:NAD+ oxidoreductase RNF subunit RnfB
MDTFNIISIILILTSIGLAFGLIIFIINKALPPESSFIKKAEKISSILPEMNCGACGYPGCFAYAQALAKNSNIFLTNPCPTVLQSPEMIKNLEKLLDIKIDVKEIKMKAVVACTGDTRTIGDYRGINSCKAASTLLKGFIKCPYGCLGLGDCIKTCPNGAITVNKDTNVAVIDTNKCNGCGLCVKECPKNIIKLIPADTKIVFLCSYISIRDIYERDRGYKGCLHCMKCYKSCKYGAISWNKEKAIPEFDNLKCNLCGACIEVCPQKKLHEFSKILQKN